MVNVLDSWLSGQGSRPGLGHNLCCVLRQDMLLSLYTTGTTDILNVCLMGHLASGWTLP